MGWWGYKLFQSDHEIQLLGEVQRDVANVFGHSEKHAESSAFVNALNKFTPGVQWKFDSPTLQETIAAHEAERRSRGIPEQ